MTTEAGNKIIAEFMGGELKRDNTSNEPYYLMPNKQQLIPELLIYHLAWDCLMPVVDKIESLGYAININQKWVVITDNNGTIDDDFNYTGMPAIDKTGKKIEATWLAVIEFINWYSKNK